VALGLNTTEAPGWAQKWAEALATLLGEQQSIGLKNIADAASLPLASRWTYRPVFVLDIDGANTRALCVSDGTNWIRTDTGAVV
jgi:hypothetical protein